MRLLQAWKQSARKLKKEIYAIYLAGKDPRVPWYARLLAVCIVAYAFSPIDLIPDPIPILGYLDDLILVPLGVWLVLKMIPPTVLAESRNRTEAEMAMGQSKPVNWIVAGMIILIWLFLGLLAALFIGHLIKS